MIGKQKCEVRLLIRESDVILTKKRGKNLYYYKYYLIDASAEKENIWLVAPLFQHRHTESPKYGWWIMVDNLLVIFS